MEFKKEDLEERFDRLTPEQRTEVDRVVAEMRKMQESE